MINKIIVIFASIILVPGCTPSITKEASQVTAYPQVNKRLDGCEKLGQVSIEYTTRMMLDKKENDTQARNELKQQAYDKYKADNLVYLSINFVKGAYREDDVIRARGIAYRCSQENS